MDEDDVDQVAGPADEDGLDQLEIAVTMADGTRYTVEVLNPDMIRFDQERTRRKLGTSQGEPITWLTFCTYAALTRTRQLDGMPWEAFQREAHYVKKVAARLADPTQLEAVPG